MHKIFQKFVLPFLQLLMLGADVKTIHVDRNRNIDFVRTAVFSVSIGFAETTVQVPGAAGRRYSLPFCSPKDGNKPIELFDFIEMVEETKRN